MIQLKTRPSTNLDAAAPKLLGAFHAGNNVTPRTLWECRHLIAMLVRNDLVGRYKGSLMGALWAFINPLGHLLLYTYVFSFIMKVKFGTTDSTGNFALYLITGLLPWTAISESLMRSTGVMLEHSSLVKKVVFPLEILPMYTTLSALVNEVVGLTVLVGLVGVLTHTVHPTILFLPLIILSQTLMVNGLSWILATLGVFLHDLRHMMTLVLSAWMYASPIVYPASAFPKSLQWINWINPVSGIVTDYRRIMIEGKMPDWQAFCTYTAFAIVCWGVGFFFFKRAKKSFADVL